MANTGQVRVLGPTRLDMANGPVELSGRQRAVVAALVFTDTATSSDDLIPLIWGDDPPRTARAALQNAIAAIRQRSGEPTLITTSSHGYRLGEQVEHDVSTLTTEAATILAADPHTLTPDVIEKTLGDWSESTFVELADIDPVAARRAGLRRMRDAVVDQLGASLIAVGRLDEAVATLQPALIDRPERQPRAGLLALALHRNGASADALRVLDLADRGAVRQTGIGAAGSLTSLEARILDNDPSLLDKGIVRELRVEPSRTTRPVRFRGRSTTIRQIGAHLASGESVVVTGGGGVGKSALVAEVAQHHDGPVIAVRCAEGPASPYEPIVEIVDQLATHSATAPRFAAAIVEGDHAALAWVLPDLGDHVALDAPLPRRELRRERADAALVQLIGALTASASALIVIDDLHQAPDASRDIALRAATETDAVVLAARRPVGSLDVDDAGVSPIELGPMDPVTVHALLADALGEDDLESVAEVAESLLRHTGGNALFLVATIRHLGDVGAFERDRGTWRLNGDIDVPPTVEAAVDLQLGRLSARGRAAVDVVAVAGDPVPIAFVEQLCGMHTRSDLEVAADEGLVTNDGTTVTPVHQLVADAVCGLMGTTRLVETHDRIATALERHPDAVEHVAAIARHRHAARHLDPAGALDAVRAAGEAAMQSQAPEFAVRYFRQAIDMIDDERSEVAVDVVTALGSALRELDDDEQVPALIEAATNARAIGRPDLVAAALIELGDAGKLSGVGAVDPTVLDLLDHALAELDDPALTARLQANASIWFAFSTDWRRCYSLWDQAARTAEEIGDPELLCAVYRLVDQTNDGPDHLERRAEVCARLRELGHELGDDLALWRAHLASYGVAAQIGTMGELSAALDGMAALEQSVFNGRGRLNLTYFQAGLAQVRGDLAGCEELMATTEGLSNPFSSSWDFVIKAAVTFVLQRERDGLHELDPIATALIESEPNSGAWRIMSAVTALAAGDADRARERLHDVADADFTTLAHDMTYILGLALAGEVAVTLGDDDVVAMIEERLRPYSGRAIWTGYFIYEPVDLTLARIAGSQGRIADAADHLDRAMEVGTRLEAPIFAGRTQCRMAGLVADHPELTSRWPDLRHDLDVASVAAAGKGWSALSREIAEAR